MHEQGPLSRCADELEEEGGWVADDELDQELLDEEESELEELEEDPESELEELELVPPEDELGQEPLDEEEEE